MKPLVIYHDNCADGFGAAFAAWLKFGDEAEYLPMQYGGTPQHPFDLRELTDGREVYVLDFSLPRLAMDQLFTDATRVVWLDHHKTAFEMFGLIANLPGNRGASSAECKLDTDFKGHICLDNNKSGALLTWEYFHPEVEVPALIQHIDDRDRWQFKLPGSKELHVAIMSYRPWSFRQWKIWLNDWDLLHGHGHEMMLEGLALLRAHKQNVQAIVKAAMRKCEFVLVSSAPAAFLSLKPEIIDPLGTFTLAGFAVNCLPELASDVGHELATQSGTFGLCWWMDNAGKIRCSLRSNGSYDVSVIAKALGGGGHRNAAGFETDAHTLLEWLK